MEFIAYAAAGSAAPDKKSDTLSSAAVAFPVYPGENCLAHDALLYQEQVEALRIMASGRAPTISYALLPMLGDTMIIKRAAPSDAS